MKFSLFWLLGIGTISMNSTVKNPELAALEQFIDIISQYSDLDDMTNEQLRMALSDSFDLAGVAVMVHMDSGHVLSCGTELTSPIADMYINMWKKQDPVFQYVQKKFFESKGRCAPIVVNTDVPEEIWRTNWLPFVSQVGISNAMILPVTQHLHITIYKTGDSPDFSECERATFNIVQFILRNMYGSFQYKKFFGGSFSSIGNFLDVNGIGYISFDETFDNLKFNATAMEYFSDISSEKPFNQLLGDVLEMLKEPPHNCTYNGYAMTLWSDSTTLLHMQRTQYCITIINDDSVRQDSKTDSPSTFDQLSKRELEILHLFARGKSYLEIADYFFISEGTVKTHLKNIYRKLNIDNQRKLIYEYISYLNKTETVL